MKLEMTFYTNIARDLSIRVGKFVWGTRGGGDNVHDPVSCNQLSRFVHLAPHGLYCGLTQSDLETDCVSTQNGPSMFDWVWYLVWSSADASVICVWHEGHNSYPEMCMKDMGGRVSTVETLISVQNEPSRLDWLWYFVWFSVDVSVVCVWHEGHNSYPEI